MVIVALEAEERLLTFKRTYENSKRYRAADVIWRQPGAACCGFCLPGRMRDLSDDCLPPMGSVASVATPDSDARLTSGEQSLLAIR